jgi:hypothetical protein
MQNVDAKCYRMSVHPLAIHGGKADGKLEGTRKPAAGKDNPAGTETSS